MINILNLTNIGIMGFYSLLTFFIAPFLTSLFIKHNQWIIGFFIGFIVSIYLWLNYGKNMIQ